MKHQDGYKSDYNSVYHHGFGTSHNCCYRQQVQVIGFGKEFGVDLIALFPLKKHSFDCSFM